MNIRDRLEGMLVCGTIGDAIASNFENSNRSFKDSDIIWEITDDTQLTLATCEVISVSDLISPQNIAERMLHWFNKGKLRGIGASTLKALRELQVGGHWALVGRVGEYAAGNGAAMRIAPLAFKSSTKRIDIEDISKITHKNDEAYCAALAVFLTLRYIISGKYTGQENIFQFLIDELPDTNVRDKLCILNEEKNRSIKEIAKDYGASGYAAESIPLAIFAASKINEISFREIIEELVNAGGDTDTNCSIAGQIIGALKGISILPKEWLEEYFEIEESNLISKIVKEWKF